MISYQVYKMLHLLGVFMIFGAFGAVLLHRMNGGTRTFAHRRLMMILHGIGVFLALVGGFGLLARIGVVGGLPGWVWAKLVIWLLFGVGISLVLRKPKVGGLEWSMIFILGVLAAYLANYKPF